MSDVLRRENYCNHLAQSVAELADRLRHFSDGAACDTALPSCTARLEISAALLCSPELAARLGPLAGLGEAVIGLLSTMKDSPGRDLGYLGPALELLSQTLETAMGRMDGGESAGMLALDPLWLPVLSRLKSAGTPLEIMDEMDACASRWEDQWCDQDLPLGQEQELRQRWLTFRDYGDAMFASVGTGANPGGAERRPHPPVVLLVHGVLRREQLVHKLQEMGYSVKTAASPEEAWVLSQAHADGGAVICDNLEPSRHLVQLNRLRVEPGPRPVLVLATSGSGHLAADLERARHQGADGVWAEPFSGNPFTAELLAMFRDRTQSEN